MDVCTSLTKIAFKSEDSPDYDKASAQVFKDSCSELNKHELSANCANEHYRLDLLYIKGPHFLLVGTLDKDTNGHTPCPESVAFVSIASKKVSFVFNQKNLMDKFSSHELGTVSLGQLFDAEESAKTIIESEFDLENNTVRFAWVMVLRNT